MAEATTMPIEQETTSRQSPKDIRTQPNEETTVAKPNFADKIGKLRISAQAATAKISQLLNPETPQGKPQKPAAPQDILNQLEILNKEKSLSLSEFLSQSRQILQSSTEIRDMVLAQKEKLKEQTYLLQADLEINIDPKIQALNRVKGFRKFLGVRREKRPFTTQKSNIQNQLAELEKQMQAKKQFADQIKTQEEPIRQKQEEVLMTAIGQEIATIRSGYEQLLQEILQDGTLLTDIRDAYVQQIISPYVDERVLEQPAKEDKRNEFYQALRTYIAHGEEPDIRMSDHKKLLHSFHYEDLTYLAEHLLNGKDKEIIKLLVARIAMQYIAPMIAPIQTGAKSQWFGYDSRDKFFMIFKKALGPLSFSNDIKGSLGQKIMDEFHKQNLVNFHDNVTLWQGVKYSKKANELFGEEIQKQDQEYCSALLDISLGPKKDGRGDPTNTQFAIYDLKYYPTPDAIRNLVLLASAYPANGLGLNEYVNRTLFNLSKRKDWQNILDNAIKAYPSLRTARPSLEKSSSTPSTELPFAYVRPGIQDAVQDFALSILQDDQTQERLADLALETLSNPSMLDFLRQKGIIADIETVSSLKEAEAFLNEFVKRRDEAKGNGGETNLPNLNSDKLKNTIRNNLFNLKRAKGDDIQQHLGSLRRLATLSRKIIENQTNFQTLPYLNSDDVVEAIAKRQADPELILLFPQQAPALMEDKMKETRTFIWTHGETLLKDTSDLKFLNRIVGEFGQKADPLIRGYQECLAARVISIDEKELTLEFARQFRVIAPATLAGYKEAKQEGHEKIYVAQLKALAERMTGSGAITDDERKKPYYKDLLRHVYSNNAGKWSSFENNDNCSDRIADLTEFKIKPRYEIDLLSNSEIRIKAGETLNHSVQDEVQQPILEVAGKMNVLENDKEKIMSSLQIEVDKTLEEIAQKGGLPGIDLKALTSAEEKMFLVLTDSIYGTGSIDPKRVKDLVITYEFAAFEDISDYIAGTRDRVGRANNQDYALLCEVGAFYSDRIKEINRRLVTAGYNNPQITSLMPEYFRKLSQDSTTTQRQKKINRLQTDRLGMSETFVKQLTRVLEKRKGRKYSPPEVEEIIRRYEGLTAGLQEKTSTSKNQQTRAFYGQLRSQREKTFEALQVIAGEKVDPKTVHLGEINLQQALETETGIKEGKYDGEQFASYTIQRFIDLFDNERTKIEAELAKFESMSGTQREILHGYITKSKESANARMVGGVCVAGDNPSKNKDQNMWDMPNYFQLVFQEPDTLQCQGLVLLHHFIQDGKKILTASINPSSTYLYSVDEAALFNGIMGTLGQFAQDNNFDMITVSQNKTIRTNRTGGQFEKTMDSRIASAGKKFKFNSPQTFSYNPNYQLQEMDVAWERNPKI